MVPLGHLFIQKHTSLLVFMFHNRNLRTRVSLLHHHPNAAGDVVKQNQEFSLTLIASGNDSWWNNGFFQKYTQCSLFLCFAIVFLEQVFHCHIVNQMWFKMLWNKNQELSKITHNTYFLCFTLGKRVWLTSGWRCYKRNTCPKINILMKRKVKCCVYSWIT